MFLLSVSIRERNTPEMWLACAPLCLRRLVGCARSIINAQRHPVVQASSDAEQWHIDQQTSSRPQSPYQPQSSGSEDWDLGAHITAGEHDEDEWQLEDQQNFSPRGRAESEEAYILPYAPAFTPTPPALRRSY